MRQQPPEIRPTYGQGSTAERYVSMNNCLVPKISFIKLENNPKIEKSILR